MKETERGGNYSLRREPKKIQSHMKPEEESFNKGCGQQCYVIESKRG